MSGDIFILQMPEMGLTLRFVLLNTLQLHALFLTITSSFENNCSLETDHKSLMILLLVDALSCGLFYTVN